jgi:hypothetical protein
MNKIIAATAITIAASVAQAHDVYGPLGQNNPEVFDEHRTISTPTMQTGRDSAVNIYGGIASGNPELYLWGQQAGSPVTDVEPGPDIYKNLCNPALAC